MIDSLTSSSLRSTATTATATSAPPKAWIASRRDEVRDLDRLVGGDVAPSFSTMPTPVGSLYRGARVLANGGA